VRRTAVPVLAVLAGAFVFGVIDAKLYDRTGGAAFWIANMSSAYLVLAFLAGRVVATWRHGAVLAVALGLAVTCLALGSFYAWQVASFHLQPVLAHSELRRYVRDGVFTGPLFGWLGHRWGLRRSWYAGVALVVPLVAERYAWQAHLGFTPTPTWVWGDEQLLGAIVAAFLVVQGVRHLRPPRPARP
jgi:hypothetical protein